MCWAGEYQAEVGTVHTATGYEFGSRYINCSLYIPGKYCTCDASKNSLRRMRVVKFVTNHTSFTWDLGLLICSVANALICNTF